MKRRNAVKNMFYFTLGASVLYSCSDPFQAVKDLGLNDLTFNNDHLKIIDQLSKIILPIQNIEEMKDHTTLPFVMNIINDLYSKNKRTIFQQGYTTFLEFYKSKSSNDWKNSPIEDQSSFVEKLILEPSTPLGEIKTQDQQIKYFLDVLKNENLQYLRTSEHVMRKARFYEMAPARYDGAFPVSNLMSTSK